MDVRKLGEDWPRDQVTGEVWTKVITVEIE